MRATLIGFSAILMWSLLALLIVTGSALLPGEHIGWHHITTALACVLITGGATLAAKNLLFARTRSEQRAGK